MPPRQPPTDPSDVLDDWDYDLPADRIARYPLDIRDASRLLVLAGAQEARHHRFAELPTLLRPGDLLVANDTRVMAARLRARRATGGAVELLLLTAGPGPVEALVRPHKRLRAGEHLHLVGGGTAKVVSLGTEGHATIALDGDPAVVMEGQGAVPLPPYLGRPAEPDDRDRYQTIFAGPLGAAAAPTAGLHFTRGLMQALRIGGIGWSTVTLHVGVGTFRPLRSSDLSRGRLHAEDYFVPESTVAAMERTRAHGGRVVAVGTTSARTLEAATPAPGEPPVVGPGRTDLFVRPPYTFRAIDGLITNFHLPRSSLLFLVGALVGREKLLAAYADAVARGYRFYSYGDAMLLL